MMKKFVTLVVAANIVAAPALATPTMADLQSKGKELLAYASDKKFMTGAAASAVVITAALWIGGKRYGCPIFGGKKGGKGNPSSSKPVSPAAAGAAVDAAVDNKKGGKRSSSASRGRPANTSSAASDSEATDKRGARSLSPAKSRTRVEADDSAPASPRTSDAAIDGSAAKRSAKPAQSPAVAAASASTPRARALASVDDEEEAPVAVASSKRKPSKTCSAGHKTFDMDANVCPKQNCKGTFSK